MKRGFRPLFAVIAAVIILMPLIRPDRAYALESMEAIIYDFTAREVPEGESSVFMADPVSIQLFRLSDDAVVEWVHALALRYNTQEVFIDEIAEVQYIKSVLSGQQPFGIHVPSFITREQAEQYISDAEALKASGELAADGGPAAVVPGGETFIDIDKTNQRLSYYVGGQLTFTTPVVTGNVSRRHTTPSGTFSVLYKQTDRTLVGPDYRSHVNYWMRIVNNIGIHDASWRSSFGGDIYKTNGSHGCINVPPSCMPELYEAVSLGTKVVVHD